MVIKGTRSLKNILTGSAIVLTLTAFYFIFTGSSNAQTPFDGNNGPDTVNQAVSVPPVISFNLDLRNDLVSSSHSDELRAGLLYDYDRKTIIWQKDMDYAYPIASLTKMMVALLTVEDIREGKADWQDKVAFEKRGVMYVKKGKKGRRVKKTYTINDAYTLDALFRLAMIASNNEACNAIAQRLGGSVDVFVKRMNDRAIALGMNHTFYSNTNGLPASSSTLDNNASPKDLLVLALEMMKYDEILNVTNIGYAEVSSEKSSGVFRNHNHLVIDYPDEVDGIKTGYTRNAKFCLVASSKKNNKRLISIALGVRGPYLRNEIVSEMINNYYDVLGMGRMGNEPSGPLYAKNSTGIQPPVTTGTEGMIASTNGTSTPNFRIVYKTVSSIVKETHKVRRGETLAGIAGEYHCTVAEVKKWNRLRSGKIMKGQNLRLYVHRSKQIPVRVDEQEYINPGCEDETDECEMTTEPAMAENVSIKPKTSATFSDKKITVKPPVAAVPSVVNKSESKVVVYKVLKGDTLFSISKKFSGVTIDSIKKLNNFKSGRELKAGAKIKIQVNG